MENHSEPVGSADIPHYVALGLGGLNLLLPRHQIYALEPRLDLEPEEEGHDYVGWIEVEGERWPVYCFSAGLCLLPEIPDKHRICVLLTHGQDYFGLLCERVMALEGTQVRLTPLPACMRTPSTPIDALALDDQGQVLCVTSVSRLVVYMLRRIQEVCSEEDQG